MKNIITEIRDNFYSSRYNVAILNERKEKDIDIVFFTNDLDRYNTYDNVVDFIERFKNTSLSESFFLKHEHRNFGETRKHIHLLYYPSLHFLKLWELPSFCTSLFLHSNVISGNISQVKELSDIYLLKDTVSFSLKDYQIGTYAQIGIYSFLYLYFNTGIYPYETLIENLLYVYRFYIIEIIKENHKNIKIENICNWEEFIKVFSKIYNKHEHLLELFLKKQNNKLNDLKNDDLINYYMEFIELISDKNISL